MNYPNTPSGAGMKAKTAIANATKRSRKTGNLISTVSGDYKKATKGLQNVGTQIRKNLAAGQASPKSSRADYSINPLKGAGGAFKSAFK